MNWYWIALCVFGWLACSIFTFWACLRSQQILFRRVTRGDVGFFIYIAAHGPFSLGAGIGALCNGKFKRFWSKVVWP